MPPLCAQQASRVPLSFSALLGIFPVGGNSTLGDHLPRLQEPSRCGLQWLGLGTPSLFADSEALRTGFRRKPDSIPMIAEDGGFIRKGNRNLPLNDLGPACRGGRRVRDVQQRVKHSAIPGWRRPCMGS
jgi:hypothetical protein